MGAMKVGHIVGIAGVIAVVAAGLGLAHYADQQPDSVAAIVSTVETLAPASVVESAASRKLVADLKRGENLMGLLLELSQPRPNGDRCAMLYNFIPEKNLIVIVDSRALLHEVNLSEIGKLHISRLVSPNEGNSEACRRLVVGDKPN